MYDNDQDDHTTHLDPAAASLPSSAISSVTTVVAPKLVRYCNCIRYEYQAQ